MSAGALSVFVLGADEPLVCDPGGRYELTCWSDYVIVSDEELTLPRGLGRRLPQSEAGRHQLLVNFDDYVGEVDLGSCTLAVRSSKLDAEGFDALLREITARCATLPFDYQSPTLIPYERTALDERDLLYHAFTYLRWAIRDASPGLIEVLALVESDPHRALVREAAEQPLWQVRGASPAMIQDALTTPARWCDLPPASRARESSLARLIAARCGRAALPASVREPRARSTYDTPENRFVRYFLEFLTELLDRAAERFAMADEAAGLLEATLAEEAGLLRREIEPWRRRAFLDEVGPMRVFPASSQVLQRRTGYRELLEHYLALVLAARYPISGADLARLLQAKEASLLYEYWTFFETSDILRELLGEPLEAQALVRSDDFAATVPENEIRLRFRGDVELAYNRSFGGNRRGSYSVTLRPDITLDVGAVRHFLDAKFRVERRSAAPLTAEEAENEAIAQALPSGWFKAEDIRKMHTYREAIRGAPGSDEKEVGSVWVIYPGTELAFFDVERGRLPSLPQAEGELRGVGAVPHAPGEEGTALRALLRRLLCGNLALAASAERRAPLPRPFEPGDEYPSGSHAEFGSGDLERDMWLRPNRQLADERSILLYAISVDGYAYAEELCGRSLAEMLEELRARCAGSHLRGALFVELRLYLFYLQRALRHSRQGGVLHVRREDGSLASAVPPGGPDEAEVSELQALHRAICDAWEREWPRRELLSRGVAGEGQHE